MRDNIWEVDDLMEKSQLLTPQQKEISIQLDQAYQKLLEMLGTDLDTALNQAYDRRK